VKVGIKFFKFVNHVLLILAHFFKLINFFENQSFVSCIHYTIPNIGDYASMKSNLKS